MTSSSQIQSKVKLSFIHSFCFFFSSSSCNLSMEATSLTSSLIKNNNNKENVDPCSSLKRTSCLSTSQSSKKIAKKRKLYRKPLADITNLFEFDYSDTESPSFLSILRVSNSRARKPASSNAGPESSGLISSKSLRMGYR